VAPLIQSSSSSTQYYKWTLTAEDVAGNISSGVLTRKFVIDLRSGPYGMTEDKTPTFTWTGVTGTGISTAQIQIASNQAMTNILFTSPALTEPVSQYTLPDANALTEGIYYWRVVRPGDNTTGRLGYQLDVVNSLTAITPTLTGPATNTILGSLQLQANPLTWTAVPTTAAYQSMNYTLNLYKVSSTGALSYYINRGSSSTTYGSGLVGVPDGNYAWQVVTRVSTDGNPSNSFDGPASAFRRFTIDTTAPSVPTMTLPAANAVITTTRRPQRAAL
jgi:hypothetical protein